MESALGDDDVGMSCALGRSLTGAIAGIGREGHRMDRTLMLTSLSAGMCAEGQAWEAELDRIRAFEAGDVAGMRDARIREKRHHDVAARRNHGAYRYLVSHYGDPALVGDDGEGCPRLRRDEDELIWLLGLNAGMLAITHSGMSEGASGVPVDIAQHVVRASRCVDEERWWGLPLALRGAIWASFPSLTPEGEDEPWIQLERAAALGHDACIRVAGATYVFTAASVGETERLHQGIRDHVVPPPEEACEAAGQFRMLDRYATLMVRHESDKLWTQAEGHRTPFGALGSLPLAEEPEDDLELWPSTPTPPVEVDAAVSPEVPDAADPAAGG